MTVKSYYDGMKIVDVCIGLSSFLYSLDTVYYSLYAVVALTAYM